MNPLTQQRNELRAAVELLEKLWRAQRDRIAGDPTVRVDPEAVVDDKGAPVLMPMLTAIVAARTALLDSEPPEPTLRTRDDILEEQIRRGIEHAWRYGHGRFGLGASQLPRQDEVPAEVVRGLLAGAEASELVAVREAREEALEDAWRAVHACREDFTTPGPSLEYQRGVDRAESAIRALYVDIDVPETPCNAKSDADILCNYEPGHFGQHSWETSEDPLADVKLTWLDRLKIRWHARRTFCHRCDRQVGRLHYRRCKGAKADAEVGAAFQAHFDQHPGLWLPMPQPPKLRAPHLEWPPPPTVAADKLTTTPDSPLGRYRAHLSLGHGVTVSDSALFWQIREIHQEQHQQLSDEVFAQHSDDVTRLS